MKPEYAVPDYYRSYTSSNVISRIASFAHGSTYIGQTSSVSIGLFSEVIDSLKTDEIRKVLDAGCGNGCFSFFMSEYFDIEASGVDINQELIEIAKKQCQNNKCKFDAVDMGRLEQFSSGFFDVVLSVGSLYWGVNLGLLLSEWLRVLKSRGFIVLFLNLEEKPIPTLYQNSLEKTIFIKKKDLLKIFCDSEIQDIRIIDTNVEYIKWLKRWNSFSLECKDKLQMNLGENYKGFVNRFRTYQKLAEGGWTSRSVVIIKKP